MRVWPTNNPTPATCIPMTKNHIQRSVSSTPGKQEAVPPQRQEPAGAAGLGEYALADAARRAPLPPDYLKYGAEDEDGHCHVHHDARGKSRNSTKPSNT